MSKGNIYTPKWLDDGIVITGEFEGTRRDIRVYSNVTDRVERCRRDYKQENLKRFRDYGFNLVVCPFYAGFGVEAEKDDMQEAVKISEQCHSLGMKVGVYVQTLSSIMYETMFLEKPEAKNWVSRDQNNNIPRYSDSDWRYIPCPTCDEFDQYIKENVLKYACETVKADMIHFDNIRWWGEPEACRCPRCAAKFRKYLEKRYPTEEERYQQFGIEDFTFVNPPIFHWLKPPWKMKNIRDLMMQEWQLFKSETLTEIYESYRQYVYDINPEIAVECNITPPLGSNPTINRGAWPPDTYRQGHFFFCEMKELPGISDKGVLESRIRSYKIADATNNRAMAYTYNGNPAKLSIAEAMAFNKNCLGMMHFLHMDVDKVTLKYIKFFRENQSLFRNVSSAAQVAVLNSRETLCFHNEEPHLELALAEQSLIQSGVVFDTVFDEDLNNLNKYKLLILPDCRCMSDEQCSLVAEYVKNGGGLIVTGMSSCFYTRHLAPRPDGSLLREMLGDKYDKVVWISSLEPAVVLPQNEPGMFIRCRSYNQQWWALPKNFAEFTSALETALPAPELKLTAPKNVVMEAKIRKSDNALILHFLNYDSKNPAQVSCKLPKDAAISIYDPDGSQNSSNGNNIAIQELKTYIIAEIKYKQ